MSHEQDRAALAGARRDSEANFDTTPVGAYSQQCPARRNSPLVACVVAVTFRSDHLLGADKLLHKEVKSTIKIDKRSVVSEWSGVGAKPFKKPEWDAARGGSADSHPISQTRGTKVKVDVTIHFTKVPRGVAILSKVRGTSSTGPLNFEKQLVPGPFEKGNVITVSDGDTVTVKDLEATQALPNHVDLISKGAITWFAEVSNVEGPMGQTGPHTVYVTFDVPSGRAAFVVDGNNVQSFDETGDEQVVTEKRLAYSVLAARGLGKTDEQECVDALFKHLKDLGVGYTVNVKWVPPPDDNKTLCEPPPDLHHYLWLCNARLAGGECHNVAAGYRLACRILGTKEPMTVGHLWPWPSRLESAGYPKRGDLIQGRYDVPFKRAFAEGHPVNQMLGFVDGAGQGNLFEGVVKYRRGLYAIGDAIFDLHQTDTPAGSSDDLNASTYFAMRDVDDNIRPNPGSMNPSLGLMALQFVDMAQKSHEPAEFQYPTVKPVAVVHSDNSMDVQPGTFKWED